ncbi:MAG: glycerol-3-phosphate 1-O-acyltransferase PlsY [Ruminococcus sp.]|nr:glycerol-3-phosphate 1-O-acyltransferase PlsY [Ruminococcus sp.]
MKILLAVIIALALGYFLGSCNFSIIFVKIMTGKDIRELGSKNAGLTNTLRCAGKTCALLTLIGDVLKSVLAVYLAYWICNLLRPDSNNHFIGYIAGLGAVLGHIFPVYYKFRGGKGVLAGASAFIVIDPKVFIAVLAIFVVVLYISKYVSLASILSAIYCPVAVFLMSLVVAEYSFKLSLLYFALSVPMVALIVWKHKPNMDRLVDGTENKFSFNSDKIIKKS